jgi:hypothetical protein
VAEIGSGDQVYTSLSFLHGGARRVLLVEPKLTILSDTQRFHDAVELYKSLHSDFTLSEEEIIAKLSIASDIRQVEDEYDGKVDIMLSHVVLEHIYPIDPFMAGVNRLLSGSGTSYNVVDLSDHTYHVFSKHPLTERIAKHQALHHLRYSERTFNLINDSKCFMNRLLLPDYRRSAEEHGLSIEVTERMPFRKVPIHADIRKRLPPHCEEDLLLSSFHLTLRKNNR